MLVWRCKKGKSFLFAAAENGRPYAVILLLKRGLQVNVTDNKGNTPLHVATTKEVVKMLMAHEASCDIENRNSKTPI